MTHRLYKSQDLVIYSNEVLCTRTCPDDDLSGAQYGKTGVSGWVSTSLPLASRITQTYSISSTNIPYVMHVGVPCSSTMKLMKERKERAAHLSGLHFPTCTPSPIRFLFPFCMDQSTSHVHAISRLQREPWRLTSSNCIDAQSSVFAHASMNIHPET